MLHGDYIGFVDSDDYIEKDMYKTLVDILEENNADVSMVNFLPIYENYDYIKSGVDNQLYVFDRERALKESLLGNKIQDFAWNKLYKKELFNDIQYPVGKNFEDIDVLYRILLKTNKVAFLNTCKYNYVQRENSIIATESMKSMQDSLDIAAERYKILSNVSDMDIKKYNEFCYFRRVLITFNTCIRLKYSKIVTNIYDDLEKLKSIYSNNFEFINAHLSKYYLDLYNLMLLDRNIGIPEIGKLCNKSQKSKG